MAQPAIRALRREELPISILPFCPAYSQDEVDGWHFQSDFQVTVPGFITIRPRGVRWGCERPIGRRCQRREVRCRGWLTRRCARGTFRWVRDIVPTKDLKAIFSP
jgi:hypothetical protein